MPHIERLQKLADHLLRGKLGHEVFSFDCYNSGSKPVCGTTGCAIGECPIVWPDVWHFDNNGQPVIDGFGTRESGVYFFDIEIDQYMHLFVPDNQNTDNYGGEELDESASRVDVANNILEFIKTVK